MTRLGTLIDATDFVSRISGKSNERGLLGIAFHKQFATNGRLVVFVVHIWIRSTTAVRQTG